MPFTNTDSTLAGDAEDLDFEMDPDHGPAESSALRVSQTLQNLGLQPVTVCANCPNAVWFTASAAAQVPRVFCRLLHHEIDFQMSQCDGNPNLAPVLGSSDLLASSPTNDLASEEMMSGILDDLMPKDPGTTGE